MTTLTDAEVLKRALTYKWDNYAFAISGKGARRVGLIFQRGEYEDVQFCNLEAEELPDGVAKRLEDNWKRKKFDGEPDIKYLRCVEVPGLGTQHVMQRLPASGSEGEMFRCSRCACLRSGHANFGRDGFWSAYTLNAPRLQAEKRSSRQAQREFEAWRDFHAPCSGGGDTATKSVGHNTATRK